jgi:hypothetical protein
VKLMSKLRITPRRTPPQPDSLAASPLPDEARRKLGTLVTEVRGASKLLFLDEVTTNGDTGSAIGLWLERIADDLGAMECRRYPAESTEMK